MAFDPSIISAIPDYAGNPIEAREKAVTLKDMMDREQLNSLQLGQKKQEAKENTQVQDILKGSDYSTPQGLAETAQKVNRVSPRAAMDLLKTGQQYQSGQVQQQLDQLELADKRQGLIVNAIDPIVGQARAMKNSGASDLDIKAFITQQMPNTLQQLRSMKLGDGKPVLADDVLKFVTQVPGGYTLQTLESWEGVTKQGKELIKQRLDQFKADTQAKGEQTRERGQDERERADRAREATAAQKQQGREFGGAAGELLGALADRGVSLPAGFRSQAQMRATLESLVKRHPDMTPDQIAQGVERGQIGFGAEKKETQIAAGISGKIRYAEQEINRLVPLVKEASAAVPRAQFVPWNRLRLYTETQTSSPQLKKLKAYLNTLSNAYDVLAARGGTDIEKRKHNREMFDAADSPEALQAAMDAVLTEARVSGEAAAASTEPRLVNTTATAQPGAAGTEGQPPSASAVKAVPGGTPAGGGTPIRTYIHKNGAKVEILE